jgi:hypothetical protein
VTAEAEPLYVYFLDGYEGPVITTEVRPGLLFDTTPDNRLIGIEVLDYVRVTGAAALPVSPTDGLDAAPSLCGCGHDKASHFPACLANVEDKPWQDFAAPFDIEKMRWGHNYVCGCPTFGSPGGAALGKRRAKNIAARLEVTRESE